MKRVAEGEYTEVPLPVGPFSPRSRAFFTFQHIHRAEKDTEYPLEKAKIFSMFSVHP